jgi:hypothetical protein
MAEGLGVWKCTYMSCLMFLLYRITKDDISCVPKINYYRDGSVSFFVSRGQFFLKRWPGRNFAPMQGDQVSA